MITRATNIEATSAVAVADVNVGGTPLVPVRLAGILLAAVGQRHPRKSIWATYGVVGGAANAISKQLLCWATPGGFSTDRDLKGWPFEYNLPAGQMAVRPGSNNVFGTAIGGGTAFSLRRKIAIQGDTAQLYPGTSEREVCDEGNVISFFGTPFVSLTSFILHGIVEIETGL